MKIVMLCNMNAAQANQPGAASRSVRFNAVVGAQCLNAHCFQNNEGQGMFEMHNVTPAISAQLQPGQLYEFVFRPHAPEAA